MTPLDAFIGGIGCGIAISLLVFGSALLFHAMWVDAVDKAARKMAPKPTRYPPGTLFPAPPPKRT